MLTTAITFYILKHVFASTPKTTFTLQELNQQLHYETANLLV